MDPDVAEHDPAWAAAFETERAVLSDVLADVLATDVEHVGSTAVAGLPAKPIIDMIAGVVSLDAATRVRARLVAHGYHYRPHRPHAQLFIRVDPGSGFDTHHLHLTVPSSALWVERLTFRDALRADPDVVRRYAQWKRLHATGDPAAPYDAVKTDFVADVLAAHGVPLLPDRERLEPPSHWP